MAVQMKDAEDVKHAAETENSRAQLQLLEGLWAFYAFIVRCLWISHFKNTDTTFQCHTVQHLKAVMHLHHTTHRCSCLFMCDAVWKLIVYAKKQSMHFLCLH